MTILAVDTSTNIMFDMFCILISLIIVISTVTSRFKWKDALNRTFFLMLFCNIIVLASDILTMVFSGGAHFHNFIIVRVFNFSAYSVGYILAFLMIDYFVAFIKTKETFLRGSVYVAKIICGIAILTVIISQFNHMYYTFDENNVYQRQDMFWITLVFAISFILIHGGIILRYRKDLGRRNTLFFISYSVIMLTAASIQTLFFGLPLFSLGTTLSLVTIYVGIQSEQARLLGQKELELSESRIDIMLSQIQPHFLYNSLVAIKQLYRQDPQKGEETLMNFTVYLRGNMDSLTNKDLVTFGEELRHVKTYLSIEKERFGDKLNVEFDAKAQEFELPTLTLQPIVENAVRYGVTKRKRGGTVTIRTEELENVWRITVTDDGMGFDPSEKKQDGRSHIGIENVRNRLTSMCGGTLEIESMLGVGTTAYITIPKGGKAK